MKNRLYLVYAGLFLLTFISSIQGATLIVTNADNSGAGSLRGAIQIANNNLEDDTIVFDVTVFSMPQTITLTSGELFIDIDSSLTPIRSVTINGPGANLLTISGNNNSRIFRVANAGMLTLSGAKLTQGNGFSNGSQSGENKGGAIFVEGGVKGSAFPNLTLIESVVIDNSTNLFGGGGGGISSIGGEMLIIDSAIVDNESNSGVGGLNTFGNLVIINSTVGNNSSSRGVGGLGVSGETMMINSTVAYNTGRFVGGLRVATSPQPINNITNSIISNNNKNENSSVNDVRDFFGTIGAGLNSIIGEGNIFRIDPPVMNFLFDIRPQLDKELRVSDKGIPYYVHGATSPALDGGSNCVLTAGTCSSSAITEDLRGLMRPIDGDGDSNSIVDIGTFEVLREEVLSAPTVAPDLRMTDDTGESNSDNITNDTDLTFDVGGFGSGILVEFMRDGEVIGSQTSDGGTLVFTDIDVEEGVHAYTTRQTVNGVKSIPGVAVIVDVDLTGPTPTIRLPEGQADPTDTQPINFAFDFDEQVVGFESADISINGSNADVSKANIIVSGKSGQNFIVSINNILSDGSILATTSAETTRDLAGNLSLLPRVFDNVIKLDTGPAAVTINQAATQADPTNDTEIEFTVIFDEQVINFDSEDISLEDSTADISNASINVIGFGATYQVTVSNFITDGGTIVAKVVKGAALDGGGNPSLASTSTDNSIFVDNVGPTGTINQSTGQADPTSQLPLNFTVIFSEEVTGFDAQDINLQGTSSDRDNAEIIISGSGTTYNVAIDNVTSNGGTIRPFVNFGAAQDTLGNSSETVSSTDNIITLDNLGPRVFVRQPFNQPDPTDIQPVRFSVEFNEQVKGFGLEDISLEGSTINTSSVQMEISGKGSSYIVSISNIRISGQVQLSVLPNAVQDSFGNPNLASINEDNVITVNVVKTSSSKFDFDGDGKSDISIFRSGTSPSQWWYLRSSDLSNAAFAFGNATDTLVPADYTGDGITDIAFWRESTGEWFVLRSEDSSFFSVPFGTSGDIPAPGDFDGDGIADTAVFRPSTATWFIQNSSGGTTITSFGISEDKPVVADYDGDGKDDIAIYRPSVNQWWQFRSTDGIIAYQFGASGDKTIQGDYTGDGKADVGVFRPSTGQWLILRSEDSSFFGFPFGISTDIPSPGDYDGDGTFDAAVFRPSTNTWFYNGSTSGNVQLNFGIAGDVPLPSVYSVP